MPTMFLGIRFTATATAANAPPIPINPFPIVSMDSDPISLIAFPNINMAAPITVKAVALERICFAFPAITEKPATSARITPTPVSPFFIVSMSIDPKPETDFSKIRSAADNSMIASPCVALKFPNFEATMNAASSAMSTPTPTSPFVSLSVSSAPSFPTAFARILIASANSIIETALVFIFPPHFESAREAATISPISIVIPTRAPANLSESILAIFLRADASTRIAADISIIAIPNLFRPFCPLNVLSNNAIDAANSAKRMLIEANAPPSLSESINDNTKSEPARTAMEPAIFISISAFRLAWKSARVSFAPLIAPLNPSIIPANPPIASSAVLSNPVRFLMNFMMPTPIPVTIPPFNRSISESNPSPRNAFIIPSITFPRASTMIPPRFAKTGADALNASTNFPIASFATSPIFLNGSILAFSLSATLISPDVSGTLKCVSANFLIATTVPSICPFTDLRIGLTLSWNFCIVWLKTSLFFAAWSRDTSHSPIFPVTLKTPEPRLPSPFVIGNTALTSAPIPCFTRSKTANRPLKVFFRFWESLSLNFKCDVNSFRPLVRFISCSDVVAGKISRNASPTGLTTLIRPLNAF